VQRAWHRRIGRHPKKRRGWSERGLQAGRSTFVEVP
jgi:hypothetical protein